MNTTQLETIKAQIDNFMLSDRIDAKSLENFNSQLVAQYGNDAQLIVEAQKYLHEKTSGLILDKSNIIEYNSKKTLYNLDTSSRYLHIGNDLRPITDYYPVERKTLGLWLLEDIIPNFFPMSDKLYKLQAPLLASLLLLNIREQPKRRDGYYMCSVPLVTLCGIQGSGKSVLLDFARLFHVPDYRVKLTSSTGAHIRDAIYAATKGDGRGIATIDNVFFNSQNSNPSLFSQWGRFVPALNAIDQVSATTGKSIRGSEDPTDIAETPLFIYKWFSSTQNPLLYDTISEAHKDFATRTLVIFRERLDPDFKTDDFDWTYLVDAYLSIWSPGKDNVVAIQKYIDTVANLRIPGTSKLISKEYGISGRRFDITLLVVATGVYQSIWENHHHAYQYLSEYFKFIDTSKDNFETGILWKAVEQFCDYWYPLKLHENMYSANYFDARVFQHDFFELVFNEGNVYNKFQSKDFDELVKYMEKKDWFYGINRYTNKVGFCRKEIIK